MTAKTDITDRLATWCQQVAHYYHGEDRVLHPQRDALGWASWITNTHPEPTAEQRAEVDAAKTRSARWMRAAAESDARSGSDGCVTQMDWGRVSHREQLAAEIAEHGGCALEPGLYTVDGQRVRARLRSGKFGSYWQCEDEHGRPTGMFFPDSRGPRSKLSKAGLVVVAEWAPSEACIAGEGYGNSGRAWATTRRTDRGYPDDAAVVLRQAA